ncbi:MAG: cyclopropane-fatty-acyl-phospholipid synthase family protein [Pseudomonadota bacterium]
MRLLSNLLHRFVEAGELQLTDSSGRTHAFGGTLEGPKVAMRLTTKSIERKLFFNPELAAAEGYMDGEITFEDGSDVHDFLTLFSINRAPLAQHRVQGLVRKSWKAMRRRQQANSVNNAKAQARSHYDLSTDLYRLFLDDGLNYSCAIFEDEKDTLEQAQKNKLRHITAKLRISEGTRVLEIGGGWGSLAITMAKAGAQVTSLNVSPEQVKIAQERVDEAGVGNRVNFVLEDYRQHQGTYDRVVSVGMMEHVGVYNFDDYFNVVRDRMIDDGFAMIHSIGRMTPPGTTGPFFRKYIFPGGYVPALSETYASLERCGLWTCDMEVLRLHYAYTLQHWRARFATNRDKAKQLYDERFCRMWEFYLSAAELGFVDGSNMVFQLLLSKKRDAVPLTRDWITDEGRRLS